MAVRYPFQPDILEAMPQGIAALYEGLEETLLEEICGRLRVSGQLNEVTVEAMRALRAQGIALNDIEKAIQKTAKITQRELDALLNDVVKQNQEYYQRVCTLADVTAPQTMVEQADIDAIRSQCQQDCANITRSMGFLVDNGRHMLPPAQAYEWALDSAVVAVQSGAKSYNEAIAGAVQQLANSGLRMVNYESGHTDRIDVAARRAVMTGVNQLNQRYREQSMEYLGTDLVEVSAHLGARNTDGPKGWENHAKWQGKVYRWKGHGGRIAAGAEPASATDNSMENPNDQPDAAYGTVDANTIAAIFGNSLNGYTAEQQQEILNLLRQAPQEIQDLFRKYGSQLEEIDENRIKGNAYFDPADGRVHICIQDTAMGGAWSPKYDTHFHEYAHNLDYLAGGKRYASMLWRSKNGESLEDIIEKDWDKDVRDFFMRDPKNGYDRYLTREYGIGGIGGKAFLRGELDEWMKSKKLTLREYQALKNEINNLDDTLGSCKKFWEKHFDMFKELVYDKHVDTSTYSFEKYPTLKMLIIELKSTLTENEKVDLSDMLERYAIKIDRDNEYPLDSGHGASYALLDGNTSIEAFAEMTSASITNPGSLEQIKKYLPNAYNAYLEILRGMI